MQVNWSVAEKAAGYDGSRAVREKAKGRDPRDESPIDGLPENCIPTSIVGREQVGSRRSAREWRESPGPPLPALAPEASASDIETRASSLADRHPRARSSFPIARV